MPIEIKIKGTGETRNIVVGENQVARFTLEDGQKMAIFGRSVRRYDNSVPISGAIRARGPNGIVEVEGSIGDISIPVGGYSLVQGQEIRVGRLIAPRNRILLRTITDIDPTSPIQDILFTGDNDIVKVKGLPFIR